MFFHFNTKRERNIFIVLGVYLLVSFVFITFNDISYDFVTIVS